MPTVGAPKKELEPADRRLLERIHRRLDEADRLRREAQADYSDLVARVGPAAVARAEGLDDETGRVTVDQRRRNWKRK